MINDNGFCYIIHNLSTALRCKSLHIKRLIEAMGKAGLKKQTYKTEQFSQCRVFIVVVCLFLIVCVMDCMVSS